ncbi:hypothetical protein [Clostridium thermosuccinogenes]|uniref:hypothetical protein n=1 Tax=Clostridium thermosuccinogenes TaxID=84032 RepID=UPI0010574DC8|nr:hypothetical protein [Pseudoclostridium thermosuccinogenes]
MLNPKSEYFTDFLKFFSAVTSTEYSCKDGKVYIEDIVVAFADIKDPVVKKVYTCDENGNSKYLFNSGEPIYLKVECDEPIRFSDNKSNHGDIQIKMTGTGDANAEITGHLIALKENYLMFKFEDTSVFNSKEVVMTAVDLTPLYGDRYWDLRDILGKKAADMGIQLVPAFQSTDKITEYGYDKSICLITDVAGNPLRELGRERQVYELNQNCYIDGISPFVEKIDVVTQMNNAKVKKALGKEKLPPSDPGYPDESDHSAAPGDNITFTATFNENLLLDGKDYPRGYYSYIQAVLNVKDEKGNPVKLDAYEVYTIVPRDYYYNPAYKDKKATIRFDTFTVKEGMTYINPEDTKIRIERIEIGNGHTLTDMNGNVYDGSVDINKNTADIKLDMTGPQITTDATPSGEGYAPKPVAFDQKNNIVQFYFPVKISDESGVNLLDGSFSWINGLPVNTDAPGETVFSFDFAVTASEQPPEDPEAWTTGAMGQLYTFTQVESGNYIHIRLLDNEQYNIGSSIIKIIAEDYAGKKGEASFNLDYSMDKGEPSASLVKTGKRYDHTQNEGALTAQVLATDNNSGLKEIYYLWVDSNGDEPNADYPGWIAAGAFTEGTKSYIFNADKEKIQGESYSGKLYVKIKDVAGNERIVPLGSYTYNIAAPKYTLEYSKIRQTEATLHISDIPTGNAVVVMIKNPGPDNIYFVSVIDDDTYGGGDILNNSSFDAGFLNDVYSWQVYRVTAKSAYQYEFEYVGSPDFLNYGLTLQSIIEGNYYGDINVTLLAGESPLEPLNFKFEDDRDQMSGAFQYKIDMGSEEAGGTGFTLLVKAGTEGGPVYVDSFTLQAAPGIESLYGEKVYNATITTSDVLDKLIQFKRTAGLPMDGLTFNPDDESDRMLSTLEGVKINVAINNNLVPVWGVEDIDFSNTYISVVRETDETLLGYDGKEYARVYLRPQEIQTVVLPKANEQYPEGYPSGRYELKLVITAAASKKTYEFTFDNFVGEAGSLQGGIFVDNTKESTQFGFAGYSYSFQNGYYGLDVNETRYYGPVYGATDENGNPISEYTASRNTIYIPVNSGPDNWLSNVLLYFTVDDMPDKKEGVGDSTALIGARAIKVWNATEGVDADESKARSVWYKVLDATDDESSKNSLYVARFVNDASEVLGAYGNTGDFGYLPLIINQLNTVYIQVINANGIASQIQTVYIYPVAGVSGTVSITDTDKPVMEGKLTFKPASGQSMKEVLGIYVYDYINPEKPAVNIIDNYDFYDNSYSLALTEPGYHMYYVYTEDIYGNYTLLGNKEWVLTDEGAPVLVSSTIENKENGYFTAKYEFSEKSFEYGMEQTLNLYFDKDYMNLLGVGSDSAGTGFTLTLSKDIIQKARDKVSVK